MTMRLLPALAVLLLTPTIAFAHSGPEHAVGFVHGFEHPLGGPDHVLAMLAVGIFAYVLGGKAFFLVPLSFVGMMVTGFALGLMQVDLPFVELGIALSSIVIGAAAATGRPMPLVLATGLVGAFAVFHGHAHGMEMPSDNNGLSYAFGFVAATTLLHVTGLLASLAVARMIGRWGRLAAQIGGGIFALGGAGILTGLL
jgi:urease accessory protein